MRIFTRKAFLFRQPVEEPPKLPDGSDNPNYLSALKQAAIIRTQPNQFQDVPEWVQKDLMFKWAFDDGDIEIMESKKDEKRIEMEEKAEKSSKAKKIGN